MHIADEVDRPQLDTFESAMASFRSGDHARAAAQCTNILASDPSHADASHLLGVVHLLGGDPVMAETLIRASRFATTNVERESDLGLALLKQKRYDEAEALLRRAVTVHPQFAIAHHHLARALEAQRNFADAEIAYRRAVELDADSAVFRFNFGKFLALIGRFTEAADQLRRAVQLRPEWAQAHNSLGITLTELNMRPQAEVAFRRALAIEPTAEALCNLGTLLIEEKRFPEAETLLRLALSFESDFAGATAALARLLSELGRVEEAIEALRRTVQLSPNDHGAFNTLGATLAGQRCFSESEQMLRRALELEPDFTAALTNLGNVLMESGRLGEAEAPLRHALEVDANSWGAAYSLALLLKHTRRIDECEAVSRRALVLMPDMAACHVGLGNALLAKGSGDVHEALNCFRRAVELDPDCRIAHTNLAYSTTFVSENGYDVLEECRRYATHFEAPYASRTVRYDNDRTPGRRLRIGYVSPDFRNHCQAMFMTPVLNNHDHGAVEVYCYSSVEFPDEVTKRLRQHADVWRDVYKLDDEQLAAQIMEDRIDVLIDLTMHMSDNRLPTFARRPAPVQISWLAYPGTTGSSAIGYRLTDPWIDPIETRHLDDRYSEKSIRLQDTFWCYDPLVTHIEVSEPPVKAHGHITFGCLNNPAKLGDKTFALWAQVMHRVEGSRLLLLIANGEARTSVSAKFAALGIDPSRITFVDYRLRDNYLRLYGQIDIVLDTFPYNGHTTSLDALWMGVPVVTIIGNTPWSRAGYGLLSNLGLTELAADSEDAFVHIAIDLSEDILRLERIRAGLRDRMTRSPLMDGKRFAASLEQAYRQAWTEWCAA
jgi:protein O-GlcNAc transferase